MADKSRVRSPKPRWSELETELLRTQARKVSLEALAIFLGRSVRSIQNKGWLEGVSMRFKPSGGDVRKRASNLDRGGATSGRKARSERKPKFGHLRQTRRRLELKDVSR